MDQYDIPDGNEPKILDNETPVIESTYSEEDNFKRLNRIYGINESDSYEDQKNTIYRFVTTATKHKRDAIFVYLSKKKEFNIQHDYHTGFKVFEEELKKDDPDLKDWEAQREWRDLPYIRRNEYKAIARQKNLARNHKYTDHVREYAENIEIYVEEIIQAQKDLAFLKSKVDEFCGSIEKHNNILNLNLNKKDEEKDFKMLLMDNKIHDSQERIDHGTWRKMPRSEPQKFFEDKSENISVSSQLERIENKLDRLILFQEKQMNKMDSIIRKSWMKLTPEERNRYDGRARVTYGSSDDVGTGFGLYMKEQLED